MSRQKLQPTLNYLGGLAENSSITDAKCTALRALVAAEYVKQGAQMPREHPWPEGKPIDAGRSVKDVRRLAKGCVVSDKLLPPIELAAYSADLGRLIAYNQKSDQSEHGRVSATYLDCMAPTVGINIDDDLWRGMHEAITLHSAVKTPTREECERMSGYKFGLLLRDLDKLVGFGKAREYAEDREEIEGQLLANSLVEEGHVPLGVIEHFERGEAIDRTTVVTYAGLMLQYVEWHNDVVFQETYKLALKTGAASIALGYIERALLPDNGEQWARIKTAAIRHGLIAA